MLSQCVSLCAASATHRLLPNNFQPSLCFLRPWRCTRYIFSLRVLPRSQRIGNRKSWRNLSAAESFAAIFAWKLAWHMILNAYATSGSHWHLRRWSSRQKWRAMTLTRTAWAWWDADPFLGTSSRRWMSMKENFSRKTSKPCKACWSNSLTLNQVLLVEWKTVVTRSAPPFSHVTKHVQNSMKRKTAVSCN